MWSSWFCSKFMQYFSNYLKYLPEVSVDSRFSSIMLRKCLVSLKNCSVFSRLMLKIAQWLLEIFLCSKCLTILRLKNVRIENSKSKIVLEIARIENFNARNARDRCFCCSVSTLVCTMQILVNKQKNIVPKKYNFCQNFYLVFTLTRIWRFITTLV